MVLDRQLLNAKLSEIREPMRSDILRHTDRLLKEYRVLFTKQKDTISYSFDFTPQDHYRSAMKHAAAGEYDRAIEDFTRSIEGHSEFTEAYFERGKLRGINGDLDGAIKDLGEAIRLSPDEERFFFVRGQAYGNKQNFHLALADFNTVVQLAPDDPNGYANRGITYFNMGQTAAALGDFDRALRLEPSNLDALFGKGLMYSTTGDYARALPILLAFVRKAEKLPEYKGKVLFARKQLQELGASSKP